MYWYCRPSQFFLIISYTAQRYSCSPQSGGTTESTLLQLVHSIFVFDQELFKGWIISSPGVSKVSLLSPKKVPEPTPWGEIIFGHARFLIWAKT